MAMKAIYYIGALLLLTFANAKADEEFRAKFGKEFVTDMKKWHAELLRNDLQHYKEVYNALLENFEPTTEEAENFKSRLDEVKAIEAQLGDSIDVNIVEKVKTFGSHVIWELISLNMNPSVISKPEKRRLVKKIIADAAAGEQQDLKEFQTKTYNKFHEMYQTIPKDELAENPEYTKIDQTLKRVSSAETKDFVAIFDYLSVFKLVANFFDVPEYKLIFQ